MADEQLRALERRWRASGSAEDVAAWLRERARTGGLDRARMRWAAACQHEGAQRALGHDGPWPAPSGLVVELAGQAEVEARFWIAILRAGWGALGDDRFLAQLWAGERALLGLPTPSYSILTYGTRASDLLMATEDLQARSLARLRGWREGPPLPVHLHLEPVEALERLEDDVPRAALLRQLRDDWAPWLLGLDDPVARRVAAHPEPPQVEGISFERPGQPLFVPDPT